MALKTVAEADFSRSISRLSRRFSGAAISKH
jgi:hypothetical protein